MKAIIYFYLEGFKMSESTILIFVLLFLFEVKHFICDYPLQNDYIVFGKGKLKGWVGPLALHSGNHGLGTLFILSMYFDLKLSIFLAVFDFISHFIIDRLKAHPKLLGRYKPNEKAFWNALGADQMGHHLMTYGIIFVAVGSNI